MPLDEPLDTVYTVFMKGNNTDIQALISKANSELGKLSAKKRFAGLTKEEISARMKKVRQAALKKKKKKKVK